MRNTAGLSYHPDMYTAAMQKLEGLRVTGRVTGGGRIVFDPKEKILSVYGYSKTFKNLTRPGCNERTAEILKRKYPDYKVDWSDKGY